MQRHHVVPLLWTIAKLIQFTFLPSIYFSIHFMGIATGCRMRSIRTSFFKLFRARTREIEQGGERKFIQNMLTHSLARKMHDTEKISCRFRNSHMHTYVSPLLFVSLQYRWAYSEHICEKERRVILISVTKRRKREKRMKWIKCQKYCQNNILRGDVWMDGWLDSIQQRMNLIVHRVV